MGYDPNQAQQMVQEVVKAPVDWAQVFYYVMAGIAALLVAIKTTFVIKARSRNARSRKNK
jgi:uncharacterized protein involved in cysteine biosynthesis